MNRSLARGLLLACVVVLLLCVSTPSYACKCLDCLCPWNWFGGAGSATTYAPPYSPVTTVAPAYTPASACSPCAATCSPCASACGPSVACYEPCATRTCCYVPQTCYRTVYRMVPVTTCQALRSCDFCSGCPVTSYRPVTTYQRCAQLIPYTTYRAVWSNPCVTSYAPCATSCPIGGTTSVVSPAASLQPLPSNGLGTKTFAAPPSPSSTPGAATTPGIRSQEKPILDPGMKPIPEPDIQPNSLRRSAPVGPSDQTASRRARRVVYLGAAPTAKRVTQQTGPIDFGGWKSARN